jgi:hypothetical protein
VLAAGELGADGGRCFKAQAASINWARRCALPALVRRPRWVELPLEYSLGTSPQNPMNWFAVANRRQSATSAAKVSAPSRVMPR